MFILLSCQIFFISESENLIAQFKIFGGKKDLGKIKNFIALKIFISTHYLGIIA